MRNVKVACVQMAMSRVREENIAKAVDITRKCAEQGANIVLLPELFERWYFCQERRYEYYEFAQSVEDNEAVKAMLKLTQKYPVALPVSFFERAGNRLFNSVAFVEDGKVTGVYRKTHIPDDHYYQEKFYFVPGDTGYKVFDTKYGKVGVGICWDQWFPETARGLALNGAEILLFPTAIGSEPILGVDSSAHWRRVMQGHSGANLMPVVASNRIGTETVQPCPENGNQKSSLTFYGTSFMTDNTGGIVAEADRSTETVLFATYDLDEYAKNRLAWGIFRDYVPLKV